MSEERAIVANQSIPQGKRVKRSSVKSAKSGVRPTAAAQNPSALIEAPATRRPAPLTNDCQIINALARGLKILTSYDPGETLLTNKDLSIRTGLAKPTVSRLTSTLVRLHFLEQDAAGGGYRLGTAAISLGLSAAAAVDIPQIAQPRMRAFAEEHDVSVLIGIRDGLDVRTLAFAPSNSSAGLRTMLGARLPLAASGVGYGLLVGMGPDEFAEVSEGLAQREGDQWSNMQKRVQFAIQDYGLHGYCASLREWNSSMNSIGAPLPRGGSASQLALACSAPSGTLNESRIRNSIGPALVRLIADIHSDYQHRQR